MPKVAVVAVAVLAAVALGIGAAFLALSGQHTAPAPLALGASPSSPAAATSGLAGTWTVDQGSVAGYRVKERFVGQSSDAEAVARTSAVTGRMTLAASGGGLQVQAASFSADLRQLKSEDANATHGNAVRDSFVGRIYLESAVFPMATYQARFGALPAVAAPADLSLPGTFTVHGVTHDVTIPIKVTRNGDRLEVVASFPLHYGDYKIDVPAVPFTTAAADAIIEVQLFLKRDG